MRSKTTKGLHACVLTAVLSTMLIASHSSAQTAKPAERPEIRPGDVWVYENIVFPAESKREFTVRVREITADAILTGGPDSGTVWGRDWAQRESKRGGQVSYQADPDRPFMRFPLQVGQRWPVNLTAKWPDG